ncbi:MAG TPA: molybdopterin-dependent oxidoreductase [Syntrophales bacterium]|nr:molybdopterin-dependent oxidoreductase [Syntrophales bacterium]
MDEKIINTVCGVCDANCGVRLRVKEGKVIKVEGLKEHPGSRGRLCPKGAVALSIAYAPDRLTYPLKRVGERGEHKWARISWDEALNITTEKLTGIKNKYGAEAFCLFRGDAPDWGAVWDYCIRFMNVFGSPNITGPGHQCHVPRVVAHRHTYGAFMPISDYRNAKTMVEWGSNSMNTNLSLSEAIEGALKNGAKLIVVDPIKTKLASKADIWLQPRPGTDGALALSMLNVIIDEELYDKEFVKDWTIGFEELVQFIKDYPPERGEEISLVPAQSIKEAARLYATNKPSCLWEGNGLDQHTNVVQTVRALAILKSITGNIDVPGGSIFPPHLRTADIRMKEKLPKEKAKIRLDGHELFYPMFDMVSYPSVIDAMLTGDPYPIKAGMVMGGNPLVTLANTQRAREAFKRLDFLVNIDIFMTRTGEIADLVLPAATYFEKTGLTFRGLAGGYLLLQQKAVEMEECWPDWKILFELAKRLGYEKEFPWRDVEEAIEEQIKPSGLTVEKLKESPEGVYYQEMRYKTYETQGFMTPSGKVEIYSKTFQEKGYDPLPVYKEPLESPYSQPELAKKYPLIGTSEGKSRAFVHTTSRNIPSLRKLDPEPLVKLHPKDAENYGIKDEDRVKVSSARGSIQMKAKVVKAALPGVVVIPWGWGQALPEANFHNLTDDMARCPISGATSSRAFLCEIEKI